MSAARFVLIALPANGHGRAIYLAPVEILTAGYGSGRSTRASGPNGPDRPDDGAQWAVYVTHLLPGGILEEQDMPGAGIYIPVPLTEGYSVSQVFNVPVEDGDEGWARAEERALEELYKWSALHD